jgi:methionine sulfoxide reductase heme-binding subunit
MDGRIVTRTDVRQVGTVTVVATVVGVAGGYAAAAWLGAAPVGRMLPWVVGRGLGIAGYLALTALTCIGLWLRHPWRRRHAGVRPASLIRVHAVLAALTGVLIVGHIVALVLDNYAGVGVAGATVPGQSGYRPFAVALGTLSIYLGLVVGGTAALAGRLFGRSWRAIHYLSFAVFGLSWLHGLLAGSDSPRLRLMYVATGALVLGTGVTSRVVPRVVVRRRPA